ncbi:MAG TPA: ABC transporter permease [Acidimicrobiales bacterium]|nr:ABC transporter permease [Acidimicrobiales bacterium]
MTVLAITRASVRRIVRDRTALFFILVLPVIVIVIVGASVRGFATFRVGVVDLGAGQAGQQLTAALDRAGDLAVTRYTSVPALTKAVARSEVSVGVLLPKAMDAVTRGGGIVEVPVLAEQANSTQQAAVTAVSSVVTHQGSLLQAARFASEIGSGSVARNLSRAARVEPGVARVVVHAVQAQSSRSVLPEGFSYSAPTELVLFVFITALAGGAAIIETRRLGMYERMATAPIRARTIIVGEALTYVTIALVQALLIVIVGAVAFGVSWGNPLGAAALVLVWALVGAGAGMVAGTLFRTPEQATAIGPASGIALGMLGGCMWPLAIVSSAMRTVGHITPHAWAVDAWTTLLARGGTVVTIAPQLGVLALFAAGLLALATVRLRRVLV